MMLVHLIMTALFSNQFQWNAFFSGISTTLAIVIIMGIPFNAFGWLIGNRRYHHLLNKQKNT